MWVAHVRGYGGLGAVICEQYSTSLLLRFSLRRQKLATVSRPAGERCVRGVVLLLRSSCPPVLFLSFFCCAAWPRLPAGLQTLVLWHHTPLRSPKSKTIFFTGFDMGFDSVGRYDFWMWYKFQYIFQNKVQYKIKHVIHISIHVLIYSGEKQHRP